MAVKRREATNPRHRKVKHQTKASRARPAGRRGSVAATGRSGRIESGSDTTQGEARGGLMRGISPKNLQQVRALADPLRLRLLEQFGREPRTTKQVAETLGEKPTRLYHHVDVLERAGLLALQRTRQNRGAVEKYFKAVAPMLDLEKAVLAPRSPASPRSEGATMAQTVLEATQQELLQVFDALQADPSTLGGGPNPMVIRGILKLPAEQMHAVQEDLLAVFKRAHDACAEAGRRKASRGAGEAAPAEPAQAAPAKQALEYSLTLIFYPLLTAPKK